MQLGAQKNVACRQALRAHLLSAAHHGRIVQQIILQNKDTLLDTVLLPRGVQQRPFLENTTPAIPARTRACVCQSGDAVVCCRARLLARNPGDINVSEAL